MTHKEYEEFILSLDGTWLDYPFGENVAVYKFGDKKQETGSLSQEDADKPEGKMFALIAEGSEPLRLSLKCDPQLAKTLREKYESVQPGHHLHKKHWNTILCTGQLDDEEIKDLIRHSYQLVGGTI